MRSPLALAAFLLAFSSPHASPGALRGVATDRLGNPLAGVTVQLASTGASTISGADGSWLLSRTAGIVAERPSNNASPLMLRREGTRLFLRWNGFGFDGRRDPTALAGFRNPAAWRTTVATHDTIVLRWMGVEARRTLPLDAQEDLGVVAFDTTGLGRFQVRASRSKTLGVDCLRLDLASLDSRDWDSLTLRFHMTGTPAEMADFAAQLDLAQMHDANGFGRPTNLPSQGISGIRPRPGVVSCLDGTVCPWIFDIPLDPMVLPPQSRLELYLLLVRRLPTGDGSGTTLASPSHDAFAGTDWSFAAHRTDLATEYPGVPLLAQDGFEERALQVPANPFVQILRGDRLLYGRGPAETP